METELQFHIESYAVDLMRGGLTREEAQRQARLELGSVEARKEDCRESLGLRLWDDLLADLRYGLRMLRKNPGFTAIAVTSLALGIGANTIIFTLAKEAMLDELAVPHPEQLRMFTIELAAHNSVIHNIWGNFYRGPDGATETTSFSYPVYQILRQQNHSLEDIFAFKELGNYDRLNATIDGHAQAITAQLVSGNYYQGLGIGTVLGRPIEPADDAVAGQGAVATISDAFWARAFGRSPGVIGKTIHVNLTPFTIVGVNPPDFTGAAEVQNSPDIFLPFTMQPVILPLQKEPLLFNKARWWIQVMGRARPGVSDGAALSQLSVTLDQAVRATMSLPKDGVLPQLRLPSGSRGLNEVGRDLSGKIYVLLALAGLVLLLACANLANLLLARSAARQREISVRLALGASQGRILRQVFTESLLLSMLGGATGLLLGYFGRNLLPRLMSTAWRPPLLSSRFDWKVFAFAAGVSVITGLLFGLAPALRSTRVSVNAGLKDSAATATKRRHGLAGKAIVVFQISLSLLLVVGAGLFVSTLRNLGRTEIGFRPEGILLFHIQPPLSRYPAAKSADLEHRIEERLAALPGVTSITLSTLPLLAQNVSDSDFVPDGQSRDAHKDESADINLVGQGFLQTMGIPLLAGRDFGSRDTETSPRVAIINQALARQFFPGDDPVGKTFKNNERHVQIVGVCGDAKYSDLRSDAPPTFYVPYRQLPDYVDMQGGVTFELRLKTPPESVLPAIRAAIAAMDRDLPLTDIRTQAEQIDALLSQERLFAVLTSVFGVLALALACVGVYGVMSYNVARRINEIGVRMALGAQAGQVLRMVMGEAWWLAMIGIGIGLCCALWVTRFLASLLYGLKPSDPATLAGAALLLLGTAVASAWPPAWRASRVQPMEALRHE